MDEVEEWRPIPGFERYAEVSSLGKVRSLTRRTPWKGSTRLVPGQLISPSGVGRGRRYLALNLIDAAGVRKSCRVHLIVLEAFHGPRPEGLHGLHRNDVPRDNRASNLYWGTPSQNARDKIRNGKNPKANQTHCDRGHGFTEENTKIRPNGTRQCMECRRLRDAGYRLARKTVRLQA